MSAPEVLTDESQAFMDAVKALCETFHPDVPVAAVSPAIDRVMERWLKLAGERDALLAACKALTHYLEPMRLVCGTPEYVACEQAIAKVEGGAQ